MRNARPHFGAGLPPTGPATKALCIAIVAASLVAALLGRSNDLDVATLQYSVAGLLNLELWRLVTYPFVLSEPLGLFIGVAVLWLFGRWFEMQWGSRDFTKFFLASSIGAGVLAIPLYFIINLVMPFHDLGGAGGPGAAIDAMLMAMALTAPDSNVLFGFVLPIRAKTLVYILVGFELVGGIMTGAARLSITLGGLGMGYLLVTGNWRPRRLLRYWTQRQRRGRAPRPTHLHVVPPGKQTLH